MAFDHWTYACFFPGKEFILAINLESRIISVIDAWKWPNLIALTAFVKSSAAQTVQSLLKAGRNLADIMRVTVEVEVRKHHRDRLLTARFS